MHGVREVRVRAGEKLVEAGRRHTGTVLVRTGLCESHGRERGG